MNKRFEAKFFEYFKNLERKLGLKPLILGGRTGSGGGGGGPPGGFYGYLPQTRVTYDLSEVATLATPASGESLVDNLNHIRYRVENVEETLSGWSPISIEEDDVLIASGVTIINFEGDVDVLDEGSGKVTVTISGGAGGGGDMYKSIYDTDDDGVVDLSEESSYAVIDTPLYTTVQDAIDQFNSSGRIGGGVLSDSGIGVAYSALSGFIKTSDSNNGEGAFFSIPSGWVSLTDNSVNYIYVDYNSGNPTVEVTTNRDDIRLTDQFTLGRAYRAGADIEEVQSGINLYNFQRRNHERLVARGLLEHMTGARIGEKATRYVTCTAGLYYVGLNKLETSAQDTSGENFDHYYYRSGAGTWSELAGTGQINNDKYNRLSDYSVQSLTSNRYGVHWIYQCFEGDLSVVLGQGDYTLALANAAQPPGALPDYLNKFAILVGKIIIKKGETTFTSVESAFITMFVPSSVNDHNDLSGLQGGTTDSYYHLTGTQHTDLTDGGETSLHSHSGGGGVDNFLDLTDTPDDYTDQEGKLVSVNALGTALEFTSPAGVSLAWNHVVIVDGEGGGDYTSVKDACDYVETQLDSDITNQWVILVMPGVYEEIPFTVPEKTAVTSFNGSISSTGDGFKTPMITPPTGDFSGTWITMNAKSKLENVELGNPGTSNPATDDVTVIRLAGSYVSIKGCVIDVGFTGTARTITTIDPNGYNLRIDGSEIWADVSAGNTSYCLFDDDWGVSELYNCTLIGGTHSVHIESYTEVYLFGCRIAEELYTDTFGVIYAAGTKYSTYDGNLLLIDNDKAMVDSGDSAPGYLIDKILAGAGIDISVDVGGGGAKYMTLTASGGGGASNFLDLDDTPDDYTTFSGWLVGVDGDEDALEFIDPDTLRGISLGERTLIVDVDGNGDYESIKTACDYVATQSPTATVPWLVLVTPGVYKSETKFTIPPYTTVSPIVSIRSDVYTADQNVYIEPDYTGWTSGAFFTLSDKSVLKGIAFAAEPLTITNHISILGHSGEVLLTPQVISCYLTIIITSNSYRCSVYNCTPNIVSQGLILDAYCYASNLGSGGQYGAYLYGTGGGNASLSFTGGMIFSYGDAVYIGGGIDYFTQYGGTLNSVGGYDIKNVGASANIVYYGGIHQTTLGDITYERVVPNFISRLLDVDPSINPSDGQVLTWNTGTDQWEAVTPGGGVGNFLDLDDTPDSYATYSGWLVGVNGAEDALEFVDPGTLVVSDAEDITYTPAVATDWDGDADPGNVDDALDQLAERITDEEGHTHAAPDASVVTFTPTTAADWDGSADPGNTDDALDQLAERVADLEIITASGDIPIVRNIAFVVTGNLSVGIGAIELENRFGETLTLLGFYLRCKTAPTGDDIIVDLNIDGSTVFSNPDNRPVIADGNTEGDTTTFDNDTWADGEALSIDIDSIGSVVAGANLTCVLKCTQ